VYMPTDFGGAGKGAPFKNEENLITFMKVYKNGTYTELMTTVIRQANRFMMLASKGQVPKVPRVLEHFTKWEPVFKDWVKDDNQVVNMHSVHIPNELMSFKKGTLQYGDESYWYLPRLLAEGKLVSETRVRIAIQHNAISKALVSTETIPEFRAIMEKVHADWKTNHLSGEDVLTSEDFINEIDEYGGVGPILEADVYRFHRNARSVRCMRRLIQSEDLFDPEILTGIYRRGPMLLKEGLYARPNGNTHPVDVTAWQYQVDRENPEEKQFLDELCAWFENQSGPAPRSFVEDDSLLVAEISKLPHHIGAIIVTDDIRLCRRVSMETFRRVFRIPVEWYYRCTYFGTGMDSILEGIRNDVRAPNAWEYFEDSGSIQSGEEKYFLDGNMFPAGLPVAKIPLTGPWSSKPVTDGTIPIGMDWERVMDAPTGYPGRLIFDQSRWRHKRRPKETTGGQW
jgi:hypothetical protein